MLSCHSNFVLRKLHITISKKIHFPTIHRPTHDGTKISLNSSLGVWDLWEV